MADYGKIYFELACRLGELSQNETRVLIYLYVCRNEKTGQCNPSRKNISENAKIEKGNLSKAIAGLEEKCWILENSDGSFRLFEASEIPEKVVSSTTKKLLNLQLSENEKLLVLQQKVVSSTTKVVSSTTLLNKELEQRKNREGTEKESPESNDSHETIWDELTTLMTKQGTLPTQARKMLGKLIKEHTLEKTVNCYTEVKDKLKNAADAYGYFKKCLANFKVKPKKPLRWLGAIKNAPTDKNVLERNPYYKDPRFLPGFELQFVPEWYRKTYEMLTEQKVPVVEFEY